MDKDPLRQKNTSSSGRTNGINLIKTRRSVRRFQPSEVPTHIIQSILEAAAAAPSAHNSQPWRFVVITSATIKHQLAIAMAEVYHQDLHMMGILPQTAAARRDRSIKSIDSAPLGIVLCLDETIFDDDDHHHDQEYCLAVQSVAVCGGYLLLAAHSEGLAGYWMCAPLFAQQAAREALGLPASWIPQALLLLGYPAQVPISPPKRRLEELVVYR